jgi:3'(2'), 5'-bisphosphate nucleotidase
MKNHGAYKIGNGNSPRKLPLPAMAKTKKTIVASRSHMSEETKKYISEIYPDESEYDVVSVGSSLKLCLVAEGSADLYPRLGPTMEWDTAAAHAIVIEADKKVNIVDEDGSDTHRPLVYNKENLLNPWFVVK